VENRTTSKCQSSSNPEGEKKGAGCTKDKPRGRKSRREKRANATRSYREDYRQRRSSTRRQSLDKFSGDKTSTSYSGKSAGQLTGSEGGEPRKNPATPYLKIGILPGAKGEPSLCYHTYKFLGKSLVGGEHPKQKKKEIA